MWLAYRRCQYGTRKLVACANRHFIDAGGRVPGKPHAYASSSMCDIRTLNGFMEWRCRICIPLAWGKGM